MGASVGGNMIQLDGVTKSELKTWDKQFFERSKQEIQLAMEAWDRKFLEQNIGKHTKQ